MTTTLTFKKIQDDYFDAAQRVEEPVVRYTGRMADTLARYVPIHSDRLQKMPDFVDQGLKFRARMVRQQETFVRHMMKAMDPVIAPAATPAKKAPVATTTMRKPTMRKPAARKVAPARKAASRTAA